MPNSKVRQFIIRFKRQEVRRRMGLKTILLSLHIFHSLLMISSIKYIFGVFLLCLTLFSNAQVNVSESSIFAPMTGPTFSFQLPGGDLAERFGSNFTIGGTFMIKTKKNVLLGVDGTFIFGGGVKNEESLLESISTEEGFVIDQYGSPAEISFYERGFHLQVKAGKLFNIIGPNPNSGLIITGGLGYLQHKIRVENIEGTAPQVMGDYAKGYDKLSGGPAISEFIGYLHLGNKKLINYFAGIELDQAWTKSKRPYDFTLMGKDESKRFDTFFGAKIGWLVPLYPKVPDAYYYY